LESKLRQSNECGSIENQESAIEHPPP
jgi:hypothetical protein